MGWVGAGVYDLGGAGELSLGPEMPLQGGFVKEIKAGIYWGWWL
jgi:hypothetical protein